jgi:hypothetical protein
MGVPEPIWFDMTAGEFLRDNRFPYAIAIEGNIVVNAISADDVAMYTDFSGTGPLSSERLKAPMVVCAKDASNYISMSVRREKAPWLRDYAITIPYEEFPEFSVPPNAFTLYTDIGSVNINPQGLVNDFANANVEWDTIELSQTKNGVTTLLASRKVPVLTSSRRRDVTNARWVHYRLTCLRDGDNDARIIGCIADIASDAGQNNAGQFYFVESMVPSADCGFYAGAVGTVVFFRALDETDTTVVPYNNKPPEGGNVVGNNLSDKFALSGPLISYFAGPNTAAGFSNTVDVTFGETPIVGNLGNGGRITPMIYHGVPASRKVLGPPIDSWPSWSAVAQAARPQLTVSLAKPSGFARELFTPSSLQLLSANVDSGVDTFFSGSWSDHSVPYQAGTHYGEPVIQTLETSGFLFLEIEPHVGYRMMPEFDYRNAARFTATLWVHYKRNPIALPVPPPPGQEVTNYQLYEGDAGIFVYSGCSSVDLLASGINPDIPLPHISAGPFSLSLEFAVAYRAIHSVNNAGKESVEVVEPTQWARRNQMSTVWSNVEISIVPN